MFKHAAQYRMLLSNYFTFSDISHHINLECMSSITQVQECEADKGKDNKSIHPINTVLAYPLVHTVRSTDYYEHCCHARQ